MKFKQYKMLKFSYCMVLAILILGFLGIYKPATVFALSCNGDGCLGRDPNTYGCSGITQKSYNLGIGVAQLRYSSGCNAKWARTQNTSAFWYYTGATVWWPSYTGIQYSYSASTNPNETVYTSMVGNSKPGQACGNLSSSPVTVPIPMNSTYNCTVFW